MGNEESKPQTLYRRISKALPPVAPQYGNNENSDWVDKGAKAFASDGDRDQFIYGLISLLTSNGSLNLDGHDIKLFFSRRQYEGIPIPSTPPTSATKPGWRQLMPGSPSEPDDGTRVLATLVAIDETGVIRVKIASETDGRDVAEAFRAFKKDVEIKLEKLLREVPSGSGGVGGVGQGREVEREKEIQRVRVAPGVDRIEQQLVDAPPAYGDVKGVKKG